MKYFNGKLDGLWYTYRENGKLEFRRDYEYSLLYGIWEEYDEEGNLIKTLTYKDGEVVMGWKLILRRAPVRDLLLFAF